VQQGEFGVDLSAIGNNDDTTSVTDYFIDVITIATDADVYVRADGPLTHTNNIDTISLANEKYVFSDTDNTVFHIPADRDSLTTTYVQIDTVLTDAMETIYLKFFLDIPTGQRAGDYDNIVEFSFPLGGNPP